MGNIHVCAIFHYDILWIVSGKQLTKGRVFAGRDEGAMLLGVCNDMIISLVEAHAIGMFGNTRPSTMWDSSRVIERGLRRKWLT